MTSLYDVLGVRADDDAQAIKQAFRAAVKANHPDLHPGDPEALLRFRRIVTANAILRDAKQRAAYDEMLEQQKRWKSNAKQERLLRLQYRRRRTRSKMGAAAAAAIVCAFSAGACGLFMWMPGTAAVAVITDKVPAVRMASIVETVKVETIKNDTAVEPAAGKDEGASAVAPVAADAGGMSGGPGSATIASAPKEEAAGTLDRPADAHAAAVVGDGAPGLGAGPSFPERDGAESVPDGDRADKGDAAPRAGREPPPVPMDADFYRKRGTVSYRTGDFPSAIVDLDEAIRLAPKDAGAYNIRGNAWDEIGVFEKALADYDEAIRLDPDNPLLFHDRAIMWHRRGNLDKALVDLDRAIRFSAADPNLYCDRGLIWYEKGRHVRAVADFNHAVKLNPRFATACISRGLIMHRNGEFNAAFADIKKTIRVSPSVFDAKKQRLASHP